MSEENVARFLEANQAFKLGDLEAWLRFFDADCAFEPQRSKEASLATRDSGDSSGAFTRTLRSSRNSRKSATSATGCSRWGQEGFAGREAAPRVTFRWRSSFRDGKIVHFKDYGDRDQALEAAGLPE
jgi:hypothetical protein